MREWGDVEMGLAFQGGSGKNILDFKGQILFLLPAPNKWLDGAVAQLVEQRTENPCVGGSIPPHTTVV